MRLPLAIVIALTGTAHAAESAPVTATSAITTQVPRIAKPSHHAIDSLCRAGSHLEVGSEACLQKQKGCGDPDSHAWLRCFRCLTLSVGCPGPPWERRVGARPDAVAFEQAGNRHAV
ncbi:hypothetical protein FHT09_001616 [Xanthomonas arboricola]|nr:hypothetical protein [Xanthomonas sp. CFBP 8152]PPT81654.1 hypothetical protein XarbCFBP8152_01295 [Xanthomonas arboricola]